MNKKPEREIKVGDSVYIFAIRGDYSITYRALKIVNFNRDENRVKLDNNHHYDISKLFFDITEGLHYHKRLALMSIMRYYTGRVSEKSTLQCLIKQAKLQVDLINRIIADQGTEIFR